MKIYHGLEDFTRLQHAVVTSGTFDGVHFGHQKILDRLKNISKDIQGETVVLTFWPHPRLVLYPDSQDLKLLNTFEEKAELLRDQGVDHLIRIPFTKEFSNTSSEDFIRKILVEQIGTRVLVIGYDHRFGKNREGRFEHLKENSKTYGFEVEEIPRQDLDKIAVSSSKIRKALEAGAAKAARELLGRPYSLSGRVVKGAMVGRLIGFPTANIEIEYAYKLIPADGAYAVQVIKEDKVMKGMLNIGFRPTVGGKSRTIEVHIFDFEQDIYGENLTIEFIDQLRQEMQFPDIESLKEQLIKDRILAKNILNS